jgi:hypothetical protein
MTQESESEPTAIEFVEIVRTAVLAGSSIDRGVMDRLIVLARRGAAIPDIATETMHDAAEAVLMTHGANLFQIYRAMIQTALKEAKP